MTDRPILFSGPMVRALLDGRKTMTRRVLKPQPFKFCRDMPNPGSWSQAHWERMYQGVWPDGTRSMQSWDYETGQRLWARETWRPQWDAEIFMCVEYRADGARVKPQIDDDHQGGRFEEMADRCHPDAESLYGPLPPNCWRPSIHMPRWASRLTLTVTDVRVQRVQEISEEDARAEGVESLRADGRQMNGLPASDAFAELWDSINAARGFGWDANPWVVAVTFDVHRCNIDQMKEAV